MHKPYLMVKIHPMLPLELLICAVSRCKTSLANNSLKIQTRGLLYAIHKCSRRISICQVRESRIITWRLDRCRLFRRRPLSTTWLIQVLLVAQATLISQTWITQLVIKCCHFLTRCTLKELSMIRGCILRPRVQRRKTDTRINHS